MVVFQLSEAFFSICNRHCWCLCIFTMIVLIIIDRIINPFITIKYQHCDAGQIQEYYMNNLSVTQLLKAKPVHLDFFEYELVNKDFCGNDDPDIDLLIFIISKSRSYERRNAIHRTYGNLRNVYRYIHNTLNIRILFLINMDENRMKSIRFEQNIFNDLVQVRIPEEDQMNIYRDLTILDWSSKYYSQTKFILKIDDVVFLNPFLLIKFINENKNDRMNIETKRPLDINIHCPTLDAHLPLLYGFKMSQLEKDITTKDEYPCEIYPEYLNDHTNIYITGILAEYLNIKRQSFIDYQINYHWKIFCEIFFTKIHPSQAFACIIDDQLPKNIFGQYYIYWERIIHYQMEK